VPVCGRACFWLVGTADRPLFLRGAEVVPVSVTQYYYRLGKDAVDLYRDDPEAFREEDYPDIESVDLYGQECLLVEDLAGQATTGVSQEELVSGAVSGFAGTSLYDDGDYPYLIDQRTVVIASRLLDAVRPDDLRRACALGRLKAKYLEVEEWLWEAWGPNVFDEVLLPKFEMIRGLYHRAAERHQLVVVGWF
jgi:hypothetical protein